MAKEYTRTFSRIGSIRPLGQILLFDDLEQLPLKWRLISAVTSARNRITSNALNGNACLQLISTSIFSPANINITVERDINPPSGGIYCCELAAAFFEPIFGAVAFDIELQCHAAQLVTGTLRWDNSSLNVQLRNSAGGFTSVGSANIFQSLTSWHKFQLVIDAAAGRYLSVQVDSQKFDIGSVSPMISALPAARGSKIQLRANGSDENIPEIHLDDIVVSQVHLPG